MDIFVPLKSFMLKLIGLGKTYLQFYQGFPRLADVSWSNIWN